MNACKEKGGGRRQATPLHLSKDRRDRLQSKKIRHMYRLKTVGLEPNGGERTQVGKKKRKWSESLRISWKRATEAAWNAMESQSHENSRAAHEPEQFYSEKGSTIEDKGGQALEEVAGGVFHHKSTPILATNIQ